MAIGSGDSGAVARARARAAYITCVAAYAGAYAAYVASVVARAPCSASAECALFCCMLPKSTPNCAAARSRTSLKFGSLIQLGKEQV